MMVKQPTDLRGSLRMVTLAWAFGAVSAALRLIALAWILDIDEPGAHTTRAAFRYMRANIYSDLQQAIFVPLRRMGLLASRTYRLTPAVWSGFRAAGPSEKTQAQAIK